MARTDDTGEYLRNYGIGPDFVLPLQELPRVFQAFGAMIPDLQAAAQAMLEAMEPVKMHLKVQRTLPRLKLSQVLGHGLVPYDPEWEPNAPEPE